MATNQVRKQIIVQWLWLGLTQTALCLVVAFNIFLDRSRVEHREQDRLVTQARVIAENMEHQLGSANAALESVRDAPAYWAGILESPTESRNLQAITKTLIGVRTVNVMDATGNITASNRTELIGRNLAYREYFQTIKQQPDTDTLYVSAPFETVLGAFAINIARMKPGPHGEFAGLVAATLDPEYFRPLMMSVQYAPDMWVSVAHGEGLLFLMMPERAGVQGMNLAQPDSFFTRHQASGNIANIFTGTVYATGEERVIALHTVQPGALKMDNPLIIAVSRDLEASFLPWRQNAFIQTGLTGIIVMTAALGLLFYQRRQLQLKQQAAEARLLAERFRVALDHLPTYIYIKNRQRQYVYANRVTLDLFNCSADELPGSTDEKFFPTETVSRLHEIDTRILEHGEDTAEKVIIPRANGERRIYWEIKTPVYDDQDKSRIWGLCGISTDITEMELLKEQLEQQANHDYLTGLCNRRYFLEQGKNEIVRAQRHGTPLSLLMLDIDHFKNINDTHGHKAGDIALQKLSNILRHTLRTIDILGRIGGEEFAILLPETELQQAAVIAERLRALVAATPLELDDGMPPQHFTASIGVTALNGGISDIDGMLHKADSALYQAKTSGRNTVCIR